MMHFLRLLQESGMLLGPFLIFCGIRALARENKKAGVICLVIGFMLFIFTIIGFTSYLIPV